MNIPRNPERISTLLELTEKTSVSDIQKTIDNAKKFHNDKYSMVIYHASNKLMSARFRDTLKSGTGEEKNTIENIFIDDSAQKLIKEKLNLELRQRNGNETQKSQLSEALKNISTPPPQDHLPLSKLEEAMKPVETINREVFITSLSTTCLPIMSSAGYENSEISKSATSQMQDFLNEVTKLMHENPDKEFEICLGPTQNNDFLLYVKEKSLSGEEDESLRKAQQRTATEGNKDSELATKFFSELLKADQEFTTGRDTKHGNNFLRAEIFHTQSVNNHVIGQLRKLLCEAM